MLKFNMAPDDVALRSFIDIALYHVALHQTLNAVFIWSIGDFHIIRFYLYHVILKYRKIEENDNVFTKQKFRHDNWNS